MRGARRRDRGRGCDRKTDKQVDAFVIFGMFLGTDAGYRTRSRREITVGGGCARWWRSALHPEAFDISVERLVDIPELLRRLRIERVQPR